MYRVTKSYGYKAICDSCKFEFHSSELRLRWDGLMVCKDDWETRHPSDFYRTRNDTHKLPFTRPDDGANPETVWTAQNTNLLTYGTVATETRTNPAGTYRVDGLLGKTSGVVALCLFYNAQDTNLLVANPLSVTTSAGGTLVLPTTPTTAGSITVRNSYGQLLGTAVITAGSANVTMPSWTGKPGHVTVSFLFGT